MKRWLALLGVLIAASCAPTPPPTPTPLPPTAILSTVVPIPTLLPTVTVVPTVLPTETATATVAPSRAASSNRTSTTFAAPAPIEPIRPALFKDGNDIQFIYEAVGKLAPTQCYLLHVELVNPRVNPGNRGDDFLDVDHCGDQGPAGKRLTFVLYRGRFRNSPNYGTILQEALAPAPDARQMQMNWTVQVVQNGGRAADGVHFKTTPLSPPSARLEFDFEP